MNDLQQKVGRGLRLSVIGQVIAQGIQFPTNLVLVRLLTPADFGLVGQVVVFTGVAYFLADLGLGTAIVQRKEIDSRALSSIYWINAVVGMALTGLYVALAPVIGAFYSNVDLVPITMVVGTTFLFTSLKVTQYNILRRNMAFERLAWVDAVALFGSAVLAIALAWMGLGPWALVFQRVIRAAIPVMMLAFMAPFRPRLILEVRPIQDMLRFGGLLMGNSVAFYATRQVDKLIVGKVFGAQALGLYLRAFDFMLLPYEQTALIVSRVLIPAMSRAGSNLEEARTLYADGLRRVTVLSFPIMSLFAVTAEPLVVTLFGRQWIAAAPIVEVFCALGMLHSVAESSGWIFVARGRADLMLRWQIINGTLQLTAMLLAVGWGFGPRGVAIALLIGNALAFGPTLVAATRLIEASAIETVTSLLPTLSCALLAAGLSVAVREGLPALPVWQTLLIVLAVGSATYIALAAAFGLRGFRRLVETATHRKSNSTEATDEGET
ncbi:MAG: lipopolysaccharide biosynthesis protein [Myxococcota bacterium]